MKTLRTGLLALALAISQAAFADCALRQSTASQEVVLPTFVDSTDGDTAETGLTIANTDIKITKGGGTTQISKNSGGATHIATGDYYTVLDATDTDTVGNLHIKVKVSGALTVWKECVVYEEAVYDALFAASAPGYVANAPVNVAQFGGTNLTATGGRPEVNVSHWHGSDLLTGTGPLAGLGVLDRGTAQSDSTTTIQLRSAAAFSDDEPNGGFALLYSATTGAGQRCLFSDYVGATDTGTCASTLVTDPTGTLRYELYGSPSAVITGTQTFNMTGNITGNLSGSVGSVTGAVGSVTGNVGGNVTGSVGSVTGAVGSVTAGVTLGNDAVSSAALSAAAAAEIVAAQLAAQGTLTGTCDSGSTTTCVDNALTQADATQLQGRLMCFNDDWCALITTFTPGTDTATTTKVAPSTRASKVYTIFPATVE